MRRRQPKYVATVNLSIWQPESAVLISLCMYSKTQPDEARGIWMKFGPSGQRCPTRRRGFVWKFGPSGRPDFYPHQGWNTGPRYGMAQKKTQWRFAIALLCRALFLRCIYGPEPVHVLKIDMCGRQPNRRPNFY